MEKKYKSLVSNTLIFAIGSFGSKLITFFFLPLYTNVLSTAEYGKAELIVAFASFFVPIVSFSIGNAVLRFGLDKNNSEEAILRVAITVNICGSIFLLLCSPLLYLYEPIKEYVGYLVVITILTAFGKSFQYYTKACGKNSLFALESILSTLILAIFNVLYLAVWKLGVKGYLQAQIISLLFSVVFLAIVNKSYVSLLIKRVDKELFVKMIKFSAPMIINAISWWVLGSTDKIMIQYFLSVESVGIYAVAAKIPTLVNTFTYFFSEAWFIAAATEYDTEKNEKFYENTFRIYSCVLIVIVFCVLLILKPFMTIYVGNDFEESWKYVPLLLVATIFRNYYDFFGSIITSAKKSTTMMLTAMAGAIINIFVNFCLIPIVGVQGAVVGTFFAYMVSGFYRIAESRRVQKFDLHLREFVLSLGLVSTYAIVIIKDKENLLLSFIFAIGLIAVNKKMIFSLMLLLKKRLIDIKAKEGEN